MFARLAWIGTALAAGLLLQIALQINTLHWLPDFPVYLGLALLSAGSAAVGAPFALAMGTGRTPARLRRCALLGFAILAVIHAVLAVRSSSSALEWWRNVLLWPAAIMGMTGCVLTSRRWAALLVLWPLGEAAAAVLACWYAPSLGESQSLRAYPYVLAAALISVLSLLIVAVSEPRFRLNWSLWAFVVASTALALICLSQPDTERAQPLMLGVATLRIGLLMVAVGGWLKDASENPSEAIAAT